jgi:cell division protein FtsB
MDSMFEGSKLKYFIGSVLLLILSASFIRSSFDVLKSKDRLDNVDAEVIKLEEKKSYLEKEIALKKTDGFVEEVARNDLNLIKEGEKVYVVKWENSDGSGQENVLSASSTETVNESPNANWYSWYQLFFGK